jgi:hypothetical protein
LLLQIYLSKSKQNHCATWVWGTNALNAWARQEDIVAFGGLDVCDGAHRLDVMKKVRGQIMEVGMLAASNVPKTARRGAPGTRRILELPNIFLCLFLSYDVAAKAGRFFFFFAFMISLLRVRSHSDAT